MMEIKFSENLKILRKQHNLTQKDLAKLIGVDQRTVSAWEKQICEPDFITLAKLCEIFNENFDSMLT